MMSSREPGALDEAGPQAGVAEGGGARGKGLEARGKGLEALGR